MRVFVTALAVVTVVVAAHPRHHGHHHGIAARAPAAPAVYVPAPVETVIVYELNGMTISEDEVRQGIANGTLIWGDDGILSTSIAPYVAPATQTANFQPQATAPAKAPLSLSFKVPANAVPSAPAASAPVSSPKQQQSAQPQQPQPQASLQPQAPSNNYNPIDQNGNCPDCGKEFPNNQIPCSQFPAGYGAVQIPNEGLGGWTGVQFARVVEAAGYSDIETAPTGSCTNGLCCKPGSFCSYACPNPYLKSSFPKMQGATGQSVGGLYCNANGKLELADGALSKTLCMKGSSHVKVVVQNRLSQPVSICRTDYPGTESMTIPLTLSPNQSGELANPDLGSYYNWQRKATSAQYYINKKGVSEKDACTWGSSADPTTGNWAPVILGTSFDPGAHMGYPSLFQNTPTNPNNKLDFSIAFSGDGVNNPCSYKSSTQEFCNGGSCDRNKGCTASVQDGKTLYITFSDN